MLPLRNIACCFLAICLVGCTDIRNIPPTANYISDSIAVAGGYTKWKKPINEGKAISISAIKQVDGAKELLDALNTICPQLFLTSQYESAEMCFLDGLQQLAPLLDKSEAETHSFFTHKFLPLKARVADFHLMLSQLYFEMTDYNKTIEHVDLGLKYFQPGLSEKQLMLLGRSGLTDSVSYGHSLAAASRASLYLKRPELAESYLQKCKTIDIGSDTHNLLMRNAACARLEIENNNYSEAARLLAEAELLQKSELGDDFAYGSQVDLFFAKGLLCEVNGNLACAKEKFELLLGEISNRKKQDYILFEATDSFKEYINQVSQVKYRSDIYFELLYKLGDINIKLGNPVAGEKYLWLAIEAVEEARAAVRSEGARIGFAGAKKRPYRDLVNLYISQGRHHEALALVERNKARALIDVLASKKTLGTGKRAEASEVLFAANRTEPVILKSGSDKQRSVDRGLIVKAANLAINEPELNNLISATPPRITELQKKLAPDETLIEYFVADNVLFAFLVKQTGPIQSFQLSLNDLSTNIRNLRTALASPGTRSYFEPAQMLYKQLIQPLESSIKTAKVTIVAHGELHYLPFSALHDGKQFMAQSYTLRLLPSASVLPYLNKNRPKAELPLLALGNPDLKDTRMDLPAAQEEATIIAKKQGGHVALRVDATETLIKKQGKNYRRLHFASHGTFNPDSPLSSALMLSSDSENDGLLTVSELYNLELNADLVTLSACETALGKISGGDDIVGFTRGLLFAGAETIVSSLWKIDDSATNNLMQDFYKNLETQTPDVALQNAQIKTMATRPHPYYWAAFQVTGAR